MVMGDFRPPEGHVWPDASGWVPVLGNVAFGSPVNGLPMGACGNYGCTLHGCVGTCGGGHMPVTPTMQPLPNWSQGIPHGGTPSEITIAGRRYKLVPIDEDGKGL